MTSALLVLVAGALAETLPVPILEVTGTDELEVGAPVSFGVFGVDAYATVWLALSIDGEGPGPCGPDGLCLGLTHPQWFFRGTSPLTGVYVWGRTVPAFLAGHTICAQSVSLVFGRWTASNVECRYVRDP